MTITDVLGDADGKSAAELYLYTVTERRPRHARGQDDLQGLVTRRTVHIGMEK